MLTDAAQLVHEHVVDTAVLYGHQRGPGHKPALRHLAAMHLQRSIQGAAHDRCGQRGLRRAVMP